MTKLLHRNVNGCLQVEPRRVGPGHVIRRAPRADTNLMNLALRWTRILRESPDHPGRPFKLLPHRAPRKLATKGRRLYAYGPRHHVQQRRKPSLASLPLLHLIIQQHHRTIGVNTKNLMFTVSHN